MMPFNFICQTFNSESRTQEVSGNYRKYMKKTSEHGINIMIVNLPSICTV